MSYPPDFARSSRGLPRPRAIVVGGNSPRDVFAREAGDRGLDWEIVAADTAAGKIEATDTSRVFRFVDDIAVRIRAGSSGARVDVRSKSRVGKGDMGANTARIRQLRDALQ